MNNDYLKQSDNEVGIDPTTLNIIESLDGPSTTDKKTKTKNTSKTKDKKNKEKKPGYQIRSALLIVVVLLCLGGVGFGVYYYLHLGQKGGGGSTKLYQPNNISVEVNSSLPTRIKDYGEFPGVDLATCELDTSEVDITTVGEYPYSIKCGNDKYSATVYVIEEIIFDIVPNLVYTVAGENVDPSKFFTINDNQKYTFKYADEEKANSALNAKGVKAIEIKVSNSENVIKSMKGVLFVTEQEYADVMNCGTSQVTSDDKKFDIREEIFFGSDGIRIDTIKIYTFFIDTDEELRSIKDGIFENGSINYDGKTGYALVDPKNKTLSIVSYSSGGIVERQDITSTAASKEDLKNYYENNRNYTCQ